MSFLQPWLLLALPLVAVPIIIHLINQWRYRTVRWGAMMFLLQANRMARGFARLRQWLIMAFRMLAIACLVFAVSRPLASGWLGLAAGGRPDTTIVLLDRSASMQQRNGGGGDSKLKTGCRQLVETLKELGSAHWILIDSASNKPQEIESPDAIFKTSAVEPTSASADIPAMLQAAAEFIKANRTGRTDVWICSDIRENDWDADGGRWQALRESFLAMRRGVRLNLLAYSEPADGNVSVRVVDVRRQQNGDAAELVLSLRLARTGTETASDAIPVHVEIGGARSELSVTMDKNVAELKDYRIALDSKRERGWGRVTIPADVNPADNDYYFAFEKPFPRNAAIVADDPQVVRPLQLAAAIAPDPALRCTAQVISEDRLAAVEWDKLSLLFWQRPLPEGVAAQRIQNFVKSGGHVIFLPAAVPGTRELFGARWTAWTDTPGKEFVVANWRGDQDLLAHTQSGAMLPLGQLQIKRYCGLKGDLTPLASLPAGAPLLARAPTSTGGVYFLTTTPALGDSSMSTNGVVLYVLIQRALAGGVSSLGNVRQLAAGPVAANDSTPWQRVAGADEAISSEYPLHRGVYTQGDRLLAVNRPVAEDEAPVVADERLAELFRGLNFIRVDHQAGHVGILIQEIWRPFLASMMVAMIVEAALCLPRSAARIEKTA